MPLDEASAASGLTDRSVWGGGRILARIIAAFLLATAGLKVVFPADVAALESVYAVPPWLSMVAVQAELVVGLWLWSGVRPDLAWKAAAGLFGIFAVFSFYRAVAGFESCGCFGRLKVHPGWTLTVDLAILALLITKREAFSVASLPAQNRWANRKWVGIAGYIPLGAASAALMISSTPARLEIVDEAMADGQLVILEPSTWVGKQFPLTAHIRPAVDLSHGDWIALIYHHDCPKCQEALPKYEQLARGALEAGKSANVLLIQAPPIAPTAHPGDSPATHAELDDGREWFVQAPVEIGLEDGIVAFASLELPSVSTVQ